MTFDCLVLGLGGVGSSVLCHLARRGLRVCGVDQYGPVHNRGSSHGRTRVFRKAYFEHPDYVPLLHRAGELWKELEDVTGTSLYRPTGVLLSGPAHGETIRGSVAAAGEHRLAIRQFDSASAGNAWPMLRFPKSHTVVFEPDAGILAVEDCVRACLDQAALHGAVTRFTEPVRRWKTSDTGVTLTTDSTEYSADSLVMTAGAWSGSQFADVLPPLRVLHKVQQWHNIDKNQRDDAAGLPAFLFETEEGVYYGIPANDACTVKLARHSGGAEVANPSSVSDEGIRAEQGPCEEFARRYLNGIHPTPTRAVGCLYTMSPDGHFIIDRHPESDRVLFAAGLSGHGFKFASVLGEILADLATIGTTSLPIDFLGLKRFAAR